LPLLWKLKRFLNVARRGFYPTRTDQFQINGG
jgi:hypothetical protein